MIAPYTIKIGGVWIGAGEEIPLLPIPKEPLEEVETVEKKHTKKEITFMKAAELRKLAKEEGLVDDPDKCTGAELKEMLIKHYEL